MHKKLLVSDDFGLRSPVIQKPFQTKSASSIVARAKKGEEESTSAKIIDGIGEKK